MMASVKSERELVKPSIDWRTTMMRLPIRKSRPLFGDRFLKKKNIGTY